MSLLLYSDVFARIVLQNDKDVITNFTLTTGRLVHLIVGYAAMLIVGVLSISDSKSIGVM